jgi:hypothetical protein
MFGEQDRAAGTHCGGPAQLGTFTPDRSTAGEYAGQRVLRIAPGMNLQDHPALRRVVLVEPPDDLHVRPPVQAEQTALISTRPEVSCQLR